MTVAAEELWRTVRSLCPPGPPPCAAIARRTGLADATVSDWFRKRYVPPWPRFRLLLGYFPEAEHARLAEVWRTAWTARRAERGPRPSGRTGTAEHGSREAAGTPRLVQLPHDIADFTGRDEQVRRVTELLGRRDGNAMPIVAIHGMAGSGKTRLAVHVLRRAGTGLGEVLLYVDLGGNAPGRSAVTARDALGSLLRHLGVPDRQVPETETDRASLYRTRLEDQRAVVLLDDAASAEQVQPLLPGGSGCRVLITSRRRLDGLDGCIPVGVDTFDTAEALALLRRIVGADRVEAEPEAVRSLVRITGRLPLAVSLAARRLRSRPTWQVADLVARMAAEDSRLVELSADHVEVRTAFAVSYEHLDADARRVFRRLAVLPGREFGSQAVAAVAGTDPATASRVLEHLLDENLVLGPAADRYALHDLLAVFAAERSAAEDDPAARAQALRSGLEWYLRAAVLAAALVGPDSRRVDLPSSPVELPALGTPAAANAWYDRERATLDAVLQAALEAGHDDIGWQLPITLFAFCRSRHSWRQSQPSLHLALAAAERSADRAGAAWAEISIGIAESVLGDLAGGERRFRRAADTYRELGDPEGEGVALNNLGENHRLAGEHEAAVALFRQDLALARQRGDTSAAASSLDNIGKAELDRGRPGPAADALREALGLAEVAGDQHVEAEILHDLGRVELATGGPDALTHLRRSADRYQAVGDLAGAATVLVDLAGADADPAPRDAVAALLPHLEDPLAGQLGARLDLLGGHPVSATGTGPASPPPGAGSALEGADHP